MPELVVRPISDHRSIESGQDFKVGLLFEIPEGWHMYWKNPGDAGLAPRLSFSANTSFDAGEILWPVPEEFSQGPGLKGYGYEHELLLLASFKAEQGSKKEFKLEIKASVLKCSARLCVPERLSRSISIPFGPPILSDDEALLERWSLRVPTILPTDQAIVKYKFLEPGMLDLNVEWRIPVSSERLFIAHDPALHFQVEQESGSMRVRYAKDQNREVRQDRVDFVFVGNPGAAEQKAVELRLPVSEFK